MTPAQPTWFGQPRGLTVLFLTNMWEQFSFYGMRVLLVYYMTKQLLFTQGNASLIYGTYAACAYFTPIVGGMLADRYLGKRNAILIGGSMMALGHFMMTFESLLFPALAMIALGNGLFLPSLPSQINDLYAKDDPRLGWAYNVYYVGVNIGGLSAMVICGALGEWYGWHYGFGLAGIGMVAGLCFYIWGQRYLPEQSRQAPKADPGERGRFDRSTIMLLLAIALSVTVFRGAYEQMGNTVAVWIDASVDRSVGGWEIPRAWFQSLNPLLVMLMTPLLLAWWQRRADAGKPQPAARKMSVGALIVAAAFVLLAALERVHNGASIGAAWGVLFFAVFTLGELYILPTGLGLFARLAPKGRGATTVAAWFIASFTGNLAAGFVGKLWSQMSHSGYFLLLAAIATAAALLLRLSDPLERRLAAGKAQESESL
jgi:POT family proton-dependent oligopeptide transporter